MVVADLMAIPRVRGVLLITVQGQCELLRVDPGFLPSALAPVARGIALALRRATGFRRAELRYEQGRLLLHSAGPQGWVGLICERQGVGAMAVALRELLDALAPHPFSDIASSFGAAQEREATSAPAAAAERAPAWSEPPARESATPLPPSAEGAPATSAPRGDTPAMESITVGEAVADLAIVSEVMMRFLGRSVVANYWRDALRRAGEAGVTVGQDGIPRTGAQAHPLDPEMAGRLVAATGAVVTRCERIVVDIRAHLAESIGKRAGRWLKIEEAS
jgi:hypothetical protein